MKINFEKLKVANDIAGSSFTEINIKEAFANSVYKGCAGMEYHALAHKIYESNGEIEVNDREAELIKQAATLCVPAIYDAISNTLS